MASGKGDGTRRPVVFLADFVDVRRTPSEVRDELRAGTDWLVPLAHAATDDGDTLLVRLGPGTVGRHTGVVTRVRLGEGAPRDHGFFVPMRWEAASHRGLFPVLDGDLFVAPVDHDGCRLSLSASYRPPLEAVGRVLDTILLHRVAASTVHSFLERLAGSLEHRGERSLGAA